MEERPNPNDRRDFLKKSVLAGGLVWAAPAISTVASAGAQPAGTPAPPGGGACCTAGAFGLSVGLLGGTPQVFGQANGAVVTADVTLSGIRVQATLVGSTASSPDGGPCTAAASLATLTITGLLGVPIISASALSSRAAASCAPTCATNGGSSIASLTVGTGSPQLALSACNFGITLAGLAVIVVGEEVCNGDSLTVRALRVTVSGLVEVIVAESRAGAPDCDCATCQPGG